MHVSKINLKLTPQMSMSICADQHLQLQSFIVCFRDNLYYKKSMPTASAVFKSLSLVVALWPCNIYVGRRNKHIKQLPDIFEF